ncbi:hypothetical protein [Methylorubrum sp. SB2]|uniref:hypothetical protein n=1 Tax=Methylorubrum subtropicum TaxID=3138812 RepID=UPI00313B6AEE
MKPRLNSLVADLRATTAENREALAADLYAPEGLRVKMQAAARAGFDHLTVLGPDGLDLRETGAAAAALAWLKGEKIGHRWTARGGGDTTAGTAQDLVIDWRTAEVGGA